MIPRRSPLKRSRFGVARSTDSAGKSYASKWEREGMGWLRLREKAGEISDVLEQVTFALYIGPDKVAFVRSTRLKLNVKRPGVRIEAYRSDVVYNEGGVQIIADLKSGLFTDSYRRKSRWMETMGYPVTELHKGRTGR